MTKTKDGTAILRGIENKFTGEKKKYTSTLINGILNKKESKKKAILKEVESSLGEKK